VTQQNYYIIGDITKTAAMLMKIGKILIEVLKNMKVFIFDLHFSRMAFQDTVSTTVVSSELRCTHLRIVLLCAT